MAAGGNSAEGLPPAWLGAAAPRLRSKVGATSGRPWGGAGGGVGLRVGRRPAPRSQAGALVAAEPEEGSVAGADMGMETAVARSRGVEAARWRCGGPPG